MENLTKRRPIWIRWLQRGCCSQISTQPILSARLVSNVNVLKFGTPKYFAVMTGGMTLKFKQRLIP